MGFRARRSRPPAGTRHEPPSPTCPRRARAAAHTEKGTRSAPRRTPPEFRFPRQGPSRLIMPPGRYAPAAGTPATNVLVNLGPTPEVILVRGVGRRAQITVVGSLDMATT